MEDRKDHLKKKKKSLSYIYLFLFIGILSVVLYGYISSLHVVVSHVNIDDRYFADVFKEKTIAHLSDLHMNGSGYREKRVLELLEKIKPDLLVLTGDYIAWKKDVTPVLDFFSELNAEMGVFGVMGDYDYAVSRNSCLFCHEKGTVKKTGVHNVRMLKNEAVTVGTGNRRFAIIGFDEGNETRAGKVLEEKAPSGDYPLIILSHNPLKFKELDKNRHLLMLAGDTHGGQILLPRFLWKLLRYEKNALFNSGEFRDGKKTLYVSRGIGTSHFPLRLFCPAEIVVYHFTDSRRDI